MARIVVRPEALRNLSSQFQQAARDLTGLSARLSSAWNGMDWEARQKAGLEGQVNQARGRAGSLAAQAEDFSRYLSVKAQAFEEADQSGAQSFEGIAAGAVSVLTVSSLLLEMGQSNAPVLPEQLRELARHFNVSEDWLKTHLGGCSQKEIQDLFIRCGLTWDRAESGLSLPRMEHPEQYSTNQQLLELATFQGYGEDGKPQYGFPGKYAPGSPEFERGKEYLTRVGEGTLCFTLGTEIVSAVISFGTTTPQGGVGPSHAMLGVGPGVFASAEKEGVVYRKAMDFYLDSLEKKDILLRLQEVPGITPEQRQRAARYAAEQVGKGYNFLGLVLGVPGKFQPGGRWYCSELTYRALKEGGVDIVPQEDTSLQTLVPGAISPLAGIAASIVDWSQVSPAELTHARVNAPDLLGRMGIAGDPLETTFEM